MEINQDVAKASKMSVETTNIESPVEHPTESQKPKKYQTSSGKLGITN